MSLTRGPHYSESPLLKNVSYTKNNQSNRAIIPKKEKKKYIPPMDHPWRKASFANYAAKQKHRCGANV